MKKNATKMILLSFVLTIFLFGYTNKIGHAQTGTKIPSGVTKNQSGLNVPSGTSKNQSGLNVPSGTSKNQSGVDVPTQEIKKLEDPLGEGTSIEGLILKLFEIIIYIGVPLVAFFLILSGFMFVSAQGNPEKIETAKSRLMYTIIGAILLLGAWTISKAIKGTIEDIKKGASIETINKFI